MLHAKCPNTLFEYLERAVAKCNVVKMSDHKKACCLQVQCLLTPVLTQMEAVEYCGKSTVKH